MTEREEEEEVGGVLILMKDTASNKQFYESIVSNLVGAVSWLIIICLSDRDVHMPTDMR